MNQKSKISFGAARVDITPDYPISLAGYFNVRMWDHVIDPIEVRAIVLRRDGKKFLILSYDLVTVNECLYLGLMKEIAAMGFHKENSLLTAIHTHTAPDYRSVNRRGCNPEALPALIRAGVEAVRKADADMREGELCAAKTSDSRFCFNRRYWMKNGKVLTNPGKCNPDIVRPEGEIDTDIPLLAIRSNGKIELLIADIVNHTDTIGGTGVSPDWVGFTRRELERDFGPGSMVTVLVGCAGNINHFDVSDTFNQTNPGEAERIGKGYAETIRGAINALKPVEITEFKTYYTDVKAAPVEITPEELQNARDTVAKYKDAPDPETEDVDITSEDLARGTPIALKYFANVLIEVASHKADFIFHLSGLDLGPVAIASLPSEPFVEIGLTIKKEVFPGKLVFMVSHGNGTGNTDTNGGYIPNVCNFGRGGYETEALSDPFEKHTADKLIEGWKKAVR